MANSNILTATSLHEVTTNKMGVIGQVAMTEDGRKYRYAKNGDTALAAGAGVVAPTVADYTSVTSTANKIADAIVKTDGTVTEANASKFEDSLLTIKSARFLANGVSKNGTISLKDLLGVAADAGTAVTLKANPFCGVIAGADGIGRAEVAVPANAYFWAAIEE